MSVIAPETRYPPHGPARETSPTVPCLTHIDDCSRGGRAGPRLRRTLLGVAVSVVAEPRRLLAAGKRAALGGTAAEVVDGALAREVGRTRLGADVALGRVETLHVRNDELWEQVGEGAAKGRRQENEAEFKLHGCWILCDGVHANETKSFRKRWGQGTSPRGFALCSCLCLSTCISGACHDGIPDGEQTWLI